MLLSSGLHARPRSLLPLSVRPAPGSRPRSGLSGLWALPLAASLPALPQLSSPSLSNVYESLSAPVGLQVWQVSVPVELQLFWSVSACLALRGSVVQQEFWGAHILSQAFPGAEEPPGTPAWQSACGSASRLAPRLPPLPALYHCALGVCGGNERMRTNRRTGESARDLPAGSRELTRTRAALAAGTRSATGDVTVALPRFVGCFQPARALWSKRLSVTRRQVALSA